MFGKDFELNGFVAETASDAHWVSKQTLFISLTFFSRYKNSQTLKLMLSFCIIIQYSLIFTENK